MEEFSLPAKEIRRLAFRSAGIPRIRPALRKIKGENEIDIYDYEILFSDEATKKIMREGKTIGCFYIESPGMRSLLKRLRCDTFEALTAASSVIRPGVAESGMMREFIARHKNPARRKYLIPEMEKYLGETYGVMIYQEDVIKIAHHVAGLTLEEADLLRRAMSGKMRSHKAMQRIEKRFFDSCREKKMQPRVARELWRQIESFAGYAFSKAHSASFALLSFQVAYLKAHYPAEFLASVLNNRGGYYSAAVYAREAVRMGIKILLPCVNSSDYEYTAGKKEIRIGFMAVKNLSVISAKKIVGERKENGKYVSLIDFLVRTRIGYEEAAALIRCGATSAFKQTRPTLMRLLDVYLKHRKLYDESREDFFGAESFALEEKIKTSVEYSIEEICAVEFETFGFMASRHPLEFFPKVVNHPSIVPSAEMFRYDGKKIKMLGWFMASKRIKTKKGNIMKFLSLEDLTGTFEAVIFPKVYSVCAEKTMSMGPYLLEGKVDAENGNNLIVEKLAVLSNEEIKSFTQKDSAENKYFGDEEKVYEEDFNLVAALGKEKLRRAYL
ncbi:MAG: hypothetical protein GXO87_03110 [Chlorobi bacterium]|nr:hypothetical protein [Chlorobiota bacterium]